jgi:hypothetical protein
MEASVFACHSALAVSSYRESLERWIMNKSSFQNI